MEGTTNNARTKIGTLIKRLEVALIFAGAVVVAGLFVESWSELSAAVREHRFPNRETVGNIIVALGVAAEVALANVIAQQSRKSEDIADREIVELNAEIERLRKDNNDMALLLSFRTIGDVREFEEAMAKFPGTSFVVEVYPHAEPENLSHVLGTALQRAGWSKIGPLKRKSELGPGVCVVSITASAPASPDAATIALSDWLHRHRLSTLRFATTHPEYPVGTILIAIGPRPETLDQLRSFEQTWSARTWLSDNV